MRKSAIAVFGAVLCGTLFAADISDPAVIYLKPEKFRMWHTAEDNVVTVRWARPATASRTTLSVTGYKFSQVFENLTAESAEITLPAPDDTTKEGAYTITLAFNDGTEKSAVLGVVRGTGASASTAGVAVLPDPTAAKWGHFKAKAVTVPVPEGAESITVDGEVKPTGLGGDAGWYTVAPVKGGADTTVAVGESEVTLTADGNGLLLLFK